MRLVSIVRWRYDDGVSNLLVTRASAPFPASFLLNVHAFFQA